MSLRVAPGAPCRPGGSGTECIEPGRYVLDAGLVPGTVTIDVPAGWFEWDVGGGSEGLLVDGGTDAPDGSGWGLLFAPIGQVPLDPCDPKKGSLPSSATVDDVVTAMDRWPGFTLSGRPAPIAIDEFSGKRIELRFTGKPIDCPVSAVLRTPLGAAIDAYPMVADPSRPAQFWILDLNGTLLAIRTTDYPDVSPFEAEQGVRPNPKRHAADQLALQAMLDSIKITDQGG
jgi:hypothetical protein